MAIPATPAIHPSDRVNIIRHAVSKPDLISFAKAVEVSAELPYVAQFEAFYKRAKRSTPVEIEFIKDLLVERTFQILRKKDVTSWDYQFLMWPGRKDVWDIIKRAQKKYKEYLATISLVIKHSPLPNSLVEIILSAAFK